MPLHRFGTPLLALLAWAALAACPPEKGLPVGSYGVERVAYFWIEEAQASAIEERPFASGGARVRMQVYAKGEALAVVSANPDALAVEVVQKRIEVVVLELTTTLAGRFDLIVLSGEQEIDRITIEVADAAMLALREPVFDGSVPLRAVVGFPVLIQPRALGAHGEQLRGEGFFAVSALDLDVQPRTSFDSLWIGARSDVFVLTGSRPAQATVHVEGAGMKGDFPLEVVDPAAIDAIELVSVARTGQSAGGGVQVQIRLLGSSDGQRTVGGTCAWSVDGATQVDSHLFEDGTLAATFFTDADHFSATCEMGSAKRTFEVALAGL